MPLVILAVVGYGARRVGFITDGFLAGANKVIFYLAIPAMLFNSLYTADLGEVFDPGLMAFAAIWTIASFAIIWAITYLALRKRHPGVISAYVNGAHRGNLAMLGLPLLFGILGDGYYAAKVAVTVAVIIPIYNIQTIIMLTLHSETPKKLNAGRLTLDIIKNPPIIGTLLGLVAAFAGITLPTIAEQAIASMAALTIPLALLCLGGSMTFKGFDAKFKFALTSGLIKVVALPIVTIALALLLCFSGNSLTILMILHGAPAAVAGYVMITEFGGDTYVSGTNVMITTVLSAFTLSVLIFVFRSMGIIL